MKPRHVRILQEKIGSEDWYFTWM